MEQSVLLESNKEALVTTTASNNLYIKQSYPYTTVSSVTYLQQK